MSRAEIDIRRGHMFARNLARTYVLTDGGRAIRCLRCNMVSWHPGDVKERYCAACQAFHTEGLSNT